MIGRYLWGNIEIATTLFEIVVTYMFYKDFLGTKETINKFWYFACFVLAFAFSSVSYSFDTNPILTVTIALASRLLLSLLFQGSVKTKSFAAILVTAIMLASEIIAMYTIMIISIDITPQLLIKPGTDRLTGILISKLITFLITRILCTFKNKSKYSIPTWYWAVLLSTPVLSIFILHTLVTFSSIAGTSSMDVLSYITTISILYINIIIFYLFNRLLELLNYQTQNKLLEQQIACQLEHYKELEISQNEIRSLRHDFKNQLICISDLVKTGRCAEADRLIQSVVDVFKRENNSVYTGNAVLDSLLNAKIMSIRQKQIELDYTIEIPEKINVEPIDVCAIFGNSLDNAIEACDRIIDGIKKISLVLTYQNGNLVIALSNTTDGKVKNEDHHFLSSKRNYLKQGLGISNIERTVEKYNGLMTMQLNNNVFELNAILYGV